MSELEKGCIDDNESKNAIDPCFSAYTIADKCVLFRVICIIKRSLIMVSANHRIVYLLRRAPAVYINVFSGEATTKFPSLSKTTRGGVSPL